MPPPRAPSPAPLDPFPPLLASFRSASTVPTYAAIARSPSTETRPIDPPAETSTSAEGSTSNTTQTDGWGPQDVDSNEVLDEIRLFPSSPSTTLPPPSRPLRVMRPFERDTPESPGRLVVRAEQPAASRSAPTRGIPRLDSVLSPTSAHRPTADPTRSAAYRGLPTVLRRLAGEGIVDPAHAISRAARMDQLLDESEAQRQTWQGGIAAAIQQGYEDTGDDGSAQAGPSNGAGLNPIPLRRRRLPPMVAEPLQLNRGTRTDTANTTWLMPDDESSDTDEHDELENALLPQVLTTRRRVRSFYAHPNVAGDVDHDDWASVMGGPAPLIPLRRGANNRRRVLRLATEQAAVQQATTTSRALPVPSTTLPGMEATNTETHTEGRPIIVQTSGVRRQRSPSVADATPPAPQTKKRRKTRRMQADRLRPAYMGYAQGDSSGRSHFLWFNPPRSDSFLDSSLSSTGRTVVKFLDDPDVTETDEDACNLRTSSALLPSCGVHYFEVECINQGKEGFMSVGWMKSAASPRRLVGWDRGTFGWHADDGMCFNQSGSGSDVVAKWGAGDTVGCGIDFTTGRAFFTKNGALLGHRFSKLRTGLHPAVGLRSVGEELSINDSGPFRYDIGSHIRRVRDQIHADVLKHEVTQVPRIFLPDPIPEVEAPTDAATSAKPASGTSAHAPETIAPAEEVLAGETATAGTVVQPATEEQATADSLATTDVDMDATPTGATPPGDGIVDLTASSPVQVASLDEESSTSSSSEGSSYIMMTGPASRGAQSGSRPVVKRGDAKLPPGSALQNPLEKVTAAFVLDYLRQHGHALALESVGQRLLRQQAVPAWPPPRPSSDDYLPIVNQLKEDLLKLDGPVPLRKIKTLVSKRTRFYHWFQIHELVRRNQHARATSSLAESDSAMEFASKLKQRCADEEWNTPDAKLLELSCRTIPGELYGAHDFLEWQRRRKIDTMELDEHLRDKYGLPKETMLAHSLRIVQAIPKLANQHDSATTFIDHDRVLGFCDDTDESMDVDSGINPA